MHGARGGAPKGNKNALKHGRYSAEAISERRAFRALLREGRRAAGAALMRISPVHLSRGLPALLIAVGYPSALPD
jgi:hypothetical protein